MHHSMLSTLGPVFYPSTTVHSQQIEAHFGPALLRELTEAEECKLKEHALYFIVFTNRCGSNYLAELVHQMGAGMHRRAELFNGARVLADSKKQGYATFVDYFLGKMAEHAQAGRVGFKISIHQLLWLTRLGLLATFGSVRIINCHREDLLGQAISHYKARSTGQWHSAMAATDESPVEYSRSKLLRSLLNISTARGLLDYYCALHNPPRMDIVYEDLVAEPRVQLSRVAQFLEMNDFQPGSIDMSGVELKQQRDSGNERLRNEFRAEFAIGSGSAVSGSIE